MKVITSFKILMQLAWELGQAKLSKDLKRIEIAQKNHDEYRDLCLEADEMQLHLRMKDL